MESQSNTASQNKNQSRKNRKKHKKKKSVQVETEEIGVVVDVPKCIEPQKTENLTSSSNSREQGSQAVKPVSEDNEICRRLEDSKPLVAAGNIEMNINNKSKEDVLKEREAKKKLKIDAKKKGKQNQPPAETSSRPDAVSSPVEQKMIIKSDEKPNVCVITPNTIPPEVVNQTTVASINKVEPDKKERADVLKEREMKKKAKLEAKKKGKLHNEQPSDQEACSVKEQQQDKCTSNSSFNKDINLKLENKPENIAESVHLKDGEIKVTAITSNNATTEQKTKAQIRAERRSQQEAQRAAKLEQKLAPKVVVPTQVKTVEITRKESSVKNKENIPVIKTSDVNQHKVKLFAHLYSNFNERKSLNSQTIHPLIVRLGAQMADRVVFGSNARFLSLLNALKQVIIEFETPPDKEFSRGLDSMITSNVSYLAKCRPMSVSMTNAVKQLKAQINQLDINKHEMDAKAHITKWIKDFAKEQIDTAAEAITNEVQKKICNGDTILTYGCSSLVYTILRTVHAKGTQFRVIIVDGRPFLEGRELLRKLVAEGIHCTYVLVNALSFIMPEVTKILLGAHALLANGSVMSRVGSSQVALMAKACNIPVLVCCETHKFSERVQTDSIVYNEIANPDELISSNCNTSTALANWKSISSLTPLNVVYDVTPADLVSVVVTELGLLPCTSVPVVLRMRC